MVWGNIIITATEKEPWFYFTMGTKKDWSFLVSYGEILILLFSQKERFILFSFVSSVYEENNFSIIFNSKSLI